MVQREIEVIFQTAAAAATIEDERKEKDEFHVVAVCERVREKYIYIYR